MLKQSGQIPGQHLLEYYADNAYKKFKGRIDLDECEQVLLPSRLVVLPCLADSQRSHAHNRLDCRTERRATLRRRVCLSPASRT